MLQRFDIIIFSGVTYKFIIQCLFAIGLGGFISTSLVLSGQLWARTFSNIMTFCLLPLTGLVITSVISGNIALSLGMVGALSIIRFRHPVKSPLELSIYFLLLTIGITIPSSIGKAIVLALFSMAVLYAYSTYTKKKLLSSKGYLDLSFSREEPQFLLEITSTKKINILEQNNYTISIYEDYKNSLFIYKLSFSSKNELDKIKNNLNENVNIEEVKYSVS